MILSALYKRPRPHPNTHVPLKVLHTPSLLSPGSLQVTTLPTGIPSQRSDYETVIDGLLSDEGLIAGHFTALPDHFDSH